jgi:hypothetical protein
MRFTVEMKCPDALDRAIEEAADGEVGGPRDSEEHDIKFKAAVEKAKAVSARWFKCGEFIQVTIDTDAGTCVVEGIVCGVSEDVGDGWPRLRG